MKDVFTVEQATNGIFLKSNDYSEVMEDTHQPTTQDRDNLFHCLGRYLYSLIESGMNIESTSKVQVEININKAEQHN